MVDLTQVNQSRSLQATHPVGISQRLEVLVIPVSDVDTAKSFYANLGWRLDADFAFENGFRVVQFTPPGSGCSIQFGTGLTTAAPGSTHGSYLVVGDLISAHDDLVARGVAISEVFHLGQPGAQFQPAGSTGRLSGRAADNASYGSYASFSDPDANEWILQEVTTRLPGRIDSLSLTFTSAGELEDALRRAAKAHGAHEAHFDKADPNWPVWYAQFMAHELAGEELPQ